MTTEVFNSIRSPVYFKSFKLDSQSQNSNGFAAINQGLNKIQSTQFPARMAKLVLSWLEVAPLNPIQHEIVSEQRKAVSLVSKTYSVPKLIKTQLKLYKDTNSLYHKIHNKPSINSVIKEVSGVASRILCAAKSTLSFLFCLDATQIINLSRLSPAFTKSMNEFSCVLSLSHSSVKLVHETAKLASNITANHKHPHDAANLMKKRVKILIKITLSVIKITSLVVLALGLFFSISLSPLIALVCSTVSFTIMLTQDLRSLTKHRPSYNDSLRARIVLIN